MPQKLCLWAIIAIFPVKIKLFSMICRRVSTWMQYPQSARMHISCFRFRCLTFYHVSSTHEFCFSFGFSATSIDNFNFDKALCCHCYKHVYANSVHEMNCTSSKFSTVTIYMGCIGHPPNWLD